MQIYSQSARVTEIALWTCTGVPAAAMAAAAWSWVLKILQLDHVTSAPREVSVSMRTAVWMAVIIIRNDHSCCINAFSYSYGDILQYVHLSKAGRRRIFALLPSNPASHFRQVRSPGAQRLPRTEGDTCQICISQRWRLRLTMSATLNLVAGAPPMVWWRNRLNDQLVNVSNG